MDARSLINRLNGFYNLEEQRIKTGWEQARWQAAVMLSVYAKKGQRIKPHDLTVFPWESQYQKPGIPKELAEKVFSRWDEQLKPQ